MTPTRNMLITAGPTHEPLDAVRYIANRSSGRLGLALAEAAQAAGWHVTLLLGPVSHAPPPGVRAVRYESSEDLRRLLDEHFPACDVLIMAAAVADYRPRTTSGKLPRQAGGLTIELESTPDLVAGCAARKRPGQRIIGFALEEPEQLARRAREKLARKGLDTIVANPLETMGSDCIRAILYTATGDVLRPAETAGTVAESGLALSKAEFARWLIEWLG